MNIPQKTTKINALHILLPVCVFGSILIALVVFRTKDKAEDPCAQNLVFLWEGEYPDPVVHIQKNSTVEGYKDTCLLQTHSCTLSEGLYHPWSTQPRRYGTQKESLTYEAKNTFYSDIQTYQAGQKVIVEAVISQEHCVLRVEQDRWKGSCPSVHKFRLVSGDPNKKGRQFFEASCTEGYMAWIEVNDDFLQKEGVSRGVIQGYGKIAVQ